MTKLDRAAIQGLLDAAGEGDYGPVFDSFADNIIVENGPGAGPWRHAEGRDEFATVLLAFAAFFNGTFHQRGRYIYADDRVVISLIEESGSTPVGDTFENLAVYVTRIGANDKGDRLWTVDLDTEALPPVLGSQSDGTGDGSFGRARKSKQRRGLTHRVCNEK